MRREIFFSLLLVLAGIYAVLFGWFVWTSFVGASGYRMANGNPLGNDFLNLYSAGRLFADGHWQTIYESALFNRHQHLLVGGEIGLRLWVYPPHSLFFAWPLGLMPYPVSLTLWSMLGLGVLAIGARAAGLNWLMTLLLLVSPAALQCVYFGQTGNLITGLLLLSLSGIARGQFGGVVATLGLTLKPQMGLLIPIVWIRQGRWLAIVATTIGVIVIGVGSYLFFGSAVWRAYVTDTMPALAALELEGHGAFTRMIPSAFMSLRLLGLDGQSALAGHGAIAAGVFALSCVMVWHTRDRRKLASIALISTALVTPYLHVYDMAGALAAGLLMMSRWQMGSTFRLVTGLFVIATNWALPHVLFDLNSSGLPIAPLIMLCLLGAIIATPDVTDQSGSMPDQSSPALGSEGLQNKE